MKDSSFSAIGLAKAAAKVAKMDLGDRRVSTSILWPFDGGKVRYKDQELPEEFLALLREEQDPRRS